VTSSLAPDSRAAATMSASQNEMPQRACSPRAACSRSSVVGPEAGMYEISYTLSGFKPENGLAPRLMVVETNLNRVLFEQDIVAPEDQPITVTFQAHLPKGHPTIHVINDVLGPTTNFRATNHSSIPFISTKDARAPWQMKLTDEQGRPRYPFLILDQVSWRGPLISEQEQRRRNEYWPAEAGNLDHVRAGLEKLSHRAFRRPVSADELDGHVALVKAEIDSGSPFPDAVKTGRLSILCSKGFLFLSEGDADVQRHTLDDRHLGRARPRPKIHGAGGQWRRRALAV